MSVVTNSNLLYEGIGIVMDYLVSRITDPRSADRALEETDASERKQISFIKLKDGQTRSYPPHILVELQGGSNETGLLLNTIDTINFNILIVGRDAKEAFELTQDVYNAFVDLTPRDYFSSRNLHRPRNFCTFPSVYPHENRDGRFYGSMVLTLNFYHNT